MILKDCLLRYEGRKVRIGAYSAFIYFGVVDENLIADLKKIDPGCMKKEIMSVYKASLNDDIVILYDSNIHGRFWFESEFLKAKEKGQLLNKKEVRIGVKKPKALTYQQKKKLSGSGFDPSEYRFLMEEDGAEGFIKVSTDDKGKMSYSDESIIWLSK